MRSRLVCGCSIWLQPYTLAPVCVNPALLRWSTPVRVFDYRLVSQPLAGDSVSGVFLGDEPSMTHHGGLRNSAGQAVF